ncbi:MAG: hypothetical protein EZS28_027049 [Streblomastix strix]|uniref:Uncharacterized protein n=1 Tax=Streblomastix strix TaxID=222440 RepID=A0A5J4V503_9EUKA|nr:MAG: hypothetical protein EZS28_027049 [Streblomastix strix]
MYEPYRDDFNYANPTYYMGQTLPKSLLNTVVNGVPAHGAGQFKTSMAWLNGCCTCGYGCWCTCHRWYLGDRSTCIGLCCIQACTGYVCFGYAYALYDLCRISSRVEELNSDIRRIAHLGYDNWVREHGQQTVRLPPQTQQASYPQTVQSLPSEYIIDKENSGQN